MADPANLSAGERLRLFFREIILAEPGVDTDTAERLADRCVHYIDRLLAWDAQRQPAAAAATPETKGFDPYAFSVVVTMSKRGREALMTRLEEIKSAEHLRQLADAQHLTIDPKLTLPEELRLAIIAATEKRIAARRAAAS